MKSFRFFLVFVVAALLGGCATVQIGDQSVSSIAATALRVEKTKIRFAALAAYGLKANGSQYANITNGIYVSTDDKVSLLTKSDGQWVEHFFVLRRDLNGVALLTHGAFSHVQQLQIRTPEGTIAAHVHAPGSTFISTKAESEFAYKDLLDLGTPVAATIPLISHPPPGGGGTVVPIFIPKR